MPVDDKGREVTGITSAVSAKTTNEHGDYGDKTGGADPGSIFEDIEMEVPTTQPEPHVKQKDFVNQPQPEPEPEPEVETPEPEEPAQETEEVEETVPTEEIEVSEDEYQFLKQLAYDELIAFGVKHRKQRAASDKRLSAVEKIVTKEFIDSAVKGELPQAELNKIFKDLPDGAFQKWLAEFYETHQHDGREWKRIESGGNVTADVLEEYSSLLGKKATLSVHNYMKDEAAFDYNEAVTVPASPSGIAYEKFMNEKQVIENRLKEIHNQAASKRDNKVDVAAQQQKAQEVFEQYIGSKPDLTDDKSRDSFKQFVSEHLTNPLDVYYSAWKSNGKAKETTRKLVLRELSTIKKNSTATPEPSKSVEGTKPGKTSANYKPSDAELIKADDDYFGDVSPI